jgi:hypothetical protein
MWGGLGGRVGCRPARTRDYKWRFPSHAPATGWRGPDAVSAGVSNQPGNVICPLERRLAFLAASLRASRKRLALAERLRVISHRPFRW